MINLLGRLRPRKNDRDGTSSGRGRSRVERGLFAVMGPPQIGEDKPPAGFVPDEAANLCHRCGRPWDVHERVHAEKMTYRPCPAPRG